MGNASRLINIHKQLNIIDAFNIEQRLNAFHQFNN
jgi:hypothetical protein